MALSANTVWEVRTAGNDTNGGGFVAGATGSDYSQQDAKNTAGADISTTDAVANGTTTITSATANFGTTIVGNIIYMQGGSGSLAAGWYQVTARTDASTITVDRTVASGTGITMNIGGALASLITLGTVMIGSNRAFIKADAGYTQTASAVFAATVTPTNTVPATIIKGYTTTRTDSGRAVITLSTNTGLTAINCSSGNGLWIQNIEIDCATLGTSTGIHAGQFYMRISNCKVSNFTSYGVRFAAGNDRGQIDSCEITGGGSAATGGIVYPGSGGRVYNCWVHDNACPGIVASGSATNFVAAFNLITNNSGASSDGINTNNAGGERFVHNTIYASGRDGIRATSNFFNINTTVMSNLLVGNGGYGFNATAAGGFPATPLWDGNAYFNNTSGTRNGIDSTTGILGVGAYTNVFDVTLTGDPFTNAAGNVFTLNNTAGAGAAARAVGLPGAFPGGLTTGYLDMGAAQHIDPPKIAIIGRGGLVN